MQVTYKGDYALKSILDLALHYGEPVVTTHEMAARIDAPVKFLEQVLLELKRGGFVESKRGINGGYCLRKPPREISVGDVVRFIEGPIEPLPCAGVESEYTGCNDIRRCVFRSIWTDVALATRQIIDNANFQDLVEKVSAAKQSADVYTI